MKIKEFINEVSEQKRKNERAKSFHNFTIEIGTIIILCLATKAIFTQRSK